MNQPTLRVFDRICSTHHIQGRILEVGAVPRDTSLLCMRALSGAQEKIGINLQGPFKYKDFTILQGNANQMSLFEDEQFDAVLCNGVLEHDRFFWKTISEMKRVVKTGGWVVIGAPGYMQITEKLQTHILFRLMRKLRWLSLLPPLFRSTLTLEIHNAPGDFYRFSPQTFRDVFFCDMKNVEITTVMFPPNIIGAGMK